MSAALLDQPFAQARDVASIRYRLHPLDVGFDLRRRRVAVALSAEPELRVSYPARDGSRRVLSGPRAHVLQALRGLGFTFAAMEG